MTSSYGHVSRTPATPASAAQVTDAEALVARLASSDEGVVEVHHLSRPALQAADMDEVAAALRHRGSGGRATGPQQS